MNIPGKGNKRQVWLHLGDARSAVTDFQTESVNLIVTSPPYNLGKEYERKATLEEYLKEQEKTITELYRILSNSGSICWQVGNYIKDGEVFPLDIFYYRIFKSLGMSLRNRIIWHFGHGLHTKRRFSGRYETILWFTKSDDYVFNLDPVRVPSKYPGKRYYKGPNKGKLSGNPKGKNPSDIWQIVINDWEEGVWDIPNVKSNHVEKTLHPCQYPVELVERLVLALTDPGDLVLDPYAGVGTSLIASLKHGRRAFGIEKEEAYLDIAQERVHSLFEGTLKTRPLGKPVHKPTGQEKIVQIPDEWK